MHPQYNADVQALKDYLFPIAREAIEIPYYEDLDAGLGIMSMFALFLENADVGRKAMQRILKYETLMHYDYAGQIAVMIGEIGIAQRMISHFEDSYDKQSMYTIDTARRLGAINPETVAAGVRSHTEWDAINAGAIAARLSDRSTALRLLKKFETNGHFAAALRLAADIDERTVIDRLLTSIVEMGLYAASGGDRLLYTLCDSLLKPCHIIPHLQRHGRYVYAQILTKRQSNMTRVLVNSPQN